MKIYKRQIDTAKAVEKYQHETKPQVAPEPKQPNPNRDARLRFMQHIVRDARARS